MSIEASSWAWRLKIPPTEKVVLLAIADHADHEGRCWPGMEGLAEKAGVHRVTVAKVVKRLEDKGLLKVERRHGSVEGAGRGGSRSNIYRLQMFESSRAQHSTFESSAQSFESSRTLPESSKNHQSHSFKRARGEHWGNAPEGVDPGAWEAWTRYKGGKPHKGTVTALGNKMRGWTPEQQRAAVEHSMANGYKGLFQPRGANETSGASGSAGRRGRETDREFFDRMARLSESGARMPEGF
jgi:predicted transcriptional regulator